MNYKIVNTQPGLFGENKCSDSYKSRLHDHFDTYSILSYQSDTEIMSEPLHREIPSSIMFETDTNVFELRMPVKRTILFETEKGIFAISAPLRTEADVPKGELEGTPRMGSGLTRDLYNRFEPEFRIVLDNSESSQVDHGLTKLHVSGSMNIFLFLCFQSLTCIGKS